MSSPWQKPFRGMQIDKTHPLAKGLVGCWVFNEKTGDTVFDLSGHGNNGAIVGADWVPDGLNLVASNGDYIYAPSNNSLDITGALTLSLIYKSSLLTGDDGGLISKSGDAQKYFASASGKAYEVGILNNSIYFQISNGSSQSSASVSAAGWSEDGNSHKIIAIWDGTTNANGMKIYVDGVLAIQGASTISSIQTLDSVLDIGGYNQTWPLNAVIPSATVYNRALSPSEVAQLNREPYCFFQPVINPALLYYEAIGDVSTDLLHGKIIIKDSSIILVDGLLKVKDSVTDLFDGELKVIEKVTSLADGKLQVQDVATSQADGKLQIQDSDTDLADGKVQILNIDTDLADGKIQVQDSATDLADGKVQIQDSVTDLADGKVIVTTAGLDTGYADGKIQIKDVTTGIVDGLVKVKDSVTGLADGKVKIGNIGSNLADGLIRIKDTATGIADGKIQIKDVATGVADGLLKIIEKATSNVDGKLKIKDTIKDLADGKISISGAAVAVIRRITIENKKPTYRLVAEQPKPSLRLKTENK